jgi:hypothetical protein
MIIIYINCIDAGRSVDLQERFHVESDDTTPDEALLNSLQK